MDKNSSLDFNRFPDASSIGSTVKYRGETHRYTVCTFILIDMQVYTKTEAKTHDGLVYNSVINDIGFGIGCLRSGSSIG